MPRKKRILQNDQFYHVFNRGINKKNIQFSKHFQDLFLGQLKLSMAKAKVEIHAFCLMDNHYHFLVKTPHGNLDYFMQHFGSSLSRKINSLTGGDGALFRSRYQAIAIESDIYLIQLMKYIHRNPVEAKITETPEDYALSSYATYIKYTPKFKWVTTEFLSLMFISTHALKQFHDIPTSSKISKIYSKKQLPIVLK
jgi:putative transposase